MGDWIAKAKLYTNMTEAGNKWMWAQWSPQCDYYNRIETKIVTHICGNEGILAEKFKELFGYELKIKGVGGLKTYKKDTDTFHLFVVSGERVNPLTLGHEHTHALNHKDKTITNPDLLPNKESYKET